MKFLVSTSIFLISNFAVAALSPYWDSVKKLETVLNSDSVSNELSGPVRQVTQLNNLTYRVITSDCTLTVFLRAQIPSQPGPTTYTVRALTKSGCQ